MSAPPFPVDVHVSEPGWAEVVDDPQGFAEAMAGAVAPLLGPAPPEVGWGELSIALVSDVEIAELNARFRDRDGPTNVLSFPSDSPRVQGDVVVALQTVLRECHRSGKSPRDHLGHLLVHGILHLHGHDHMTKRDADAMEAIERRALDTVGIPDPY